MSWMLRPRIIKTEKFLGCRDTNQDWAENVDTETPMRLLLTSAL